MSFYAWLKLNQPQRNERKNPQVPPKSYPDVIKKNDPKPLDFYVVDPFSEMEFTEEELENAIKNYNEKKKKERR